MGGTLSLGDNPRASTMKIISLAPAMALAAIVGSAQPTLAQPNDQSGSSAASQAQSDMNRPDQQNRDWDRDQDRQRQPNWRQQWGEQGGGMGPHAGGMGHAAWGRGAMHDGSAHFRFTRGNARIDIKCPANEDVEHCVKAAGELVDKVMSMKENAGTAGLNPDGAPSTNPPPGHSPSPPPVGSTPGNQ
jgi:hypothetical protein